MKCHQRIIRENESEKESESLFSNPQNIILKDAEFRHIDFKTAEVIIKKYEWLGTMPTFCTHYFGIYFDGVCGGVIVFGISLPQSVLDSVCGKEWGDKVRVLSRGACTHWTPIGSASKLISYGIKELEKEGYKIILAYSDTRAGEIGTIYQACNFIYTGMSKGGLEYKIDGKWRTGIGASKFSHIVRNLDEYETRPRSTKHRYVYFMGTVKEKKLLRKLLQYKPLPYPKRPTEE